jgi:hypothetical protein
MATYYQLGPEVGRNRVVVASGANAGEVLQEAGEFPEGQKFMAESIPVVAPLKGTPLPISPYLEKPSEVKTDLLGNDRASKALSLFNYTDDYDFRDDVYVTEIQGLNETGENDEESAKWSQLERVGINYSPLPIGSFRHDPKRRGINIELAKATGGFQRARLSTRKRFRYQTGRTLRMSVCAQMSLADLPACEKLWGIGDSQDGFFFQIRASGVGDDFRIIYRRSSGDGLTKEVVVPRSEFNHDPMDGTGLSGANIDFTKNAMYLVEWGWYGASSARFYAFLVDEQENLPVTVKKVPRGRWILMHELLIPDTLNAPSLGTPVLPFTLEISNTGYLVEPQFIFKYGLSVQVDGGESEKAEILGADLSNGRDIGPILGGVAPSSFFPIFAIRAKDFANNNILNTLQGLPKTLELFANYGTELAVIRDAEFDSLDEVGHFNGNLPDDSEGDFGLAESLLLAPGGNLLIATLLFPDGLNEAFQIIDDAVLQGVLVTPDGFEPTDPFLLLTEPPEQLPLSLQDRYMATDMGTLEGNYVVKKLVRGKELTRVYIPPNKNTNVNLTAIYDLVRESITTEYDSKFDFPVVNEDYQIVDISNTGVITLDRKHTIEEGFRFVVNNVTYYARSILGEFTLTISAERKGPLLIPPFAELEYCRVFYDVVLDNAVATRARPIEQSIVAFAARRVEDGLLVTNFGEKNAQWIRASNCSTSNSYNVVSPVPEVRAFLNYGLR